MTEEKKCPHSEDCRYYVGNRGKCDDERYIECHIIQFDLLEEVKLKK